MKVFGPETHITAIVTMALIDDVKFIKSQINNNNNNSKLDEKKNDDTEKERSNIADANWESYVSGLDLSNFKWNKKWEKETINNNSDRKNDDLNDSKEEKEELKENISYDYVMTAQTSAFVYGMQPRAVQNMLDFDYISRRSTPSVAGIVYTFASGIHHRQFYWGHKEIMIPVYQSLDDAFAQNKTKKVDTIVNFASSRSAYPATLEMLNYPQIKHITIIAEGVPERFTRHLNILAKKKRCNNIRTINSRWYKTRLFSYW